MMRYLRGMVLLGVSATLWACNTEPDAIKGGDPVKIVADPDVIFIDQGATKTTLVRLVDAQGGALTAPVTISNVGAGITVTADSGFRPIYNADGELVYNNFNNELRLLITGNSLVAATFDVEAGGFTETVNVTVMPTSIDATVAGSPTDIGAPVTITAPAGLKFGANARVVDAQGNTVAFIVAYNADSTAIDVQPVPGAAGADFTVEDVRPAYAPALSLTLASTADLDVGAGVFAGFAGATSIATAPELFNPAAGGGIIDIGTDMSGDVTGTGADGGRFYKIVIPEDGTFDISLSWEGGKDLGVVLYDGAGTPVEYVADSHGTGASASPEEAEEYALAAGTYYLAVVWFDYNPQVLPDYFSLTVAPH